MQHIGINKWLLRSINVRSALLVMVGLIQMVLRIQLDQKNGHFLTHQMCITSGFGLGGRGTEKNVWLEVAMELELGPEQKGLVSLKRSATSGDITPAFSGSPQKGEEIKR